MHVRLPGVQSVDLQLPLVNECMKMKRFTPWPWFLLELLVPRISISVTVAGIAQSAERLTAEREVAGSIPGAGPLLRVLK